MNEKTYRKYKKMVDGAKLTEARIAAGLSLQDVVIALDDGCNKSSVSRWEQDKMNPSDARVKKLVKLYCTDDFVVKGNAK